MLLASSSSAPTLPTAGPSNKELSNAMEYLKAAAATNENAGPVELLQIACDAARAASDAVAHKARQRASKHARASAEQAERAKWLLFSAIWQGDHAAVDAALRSAGGNPKCSNRLGDTPLHRAAALGRTHIAELLLIAGAERLATNAEGSTSEDLARDKGHSRTADFLRDWEPSEVREAREMAERAAREQAERAARERAEREAQTRAEQAAREKREKLDSFYKSKGSSKGWLTSGNSVTVANALAG